VSAALAALIACGEPEGSEPSGSGGSAGQANAGSGGDAGRTDGGGAGAGDATGSGGSPDSEGGQTGESGSRQASAGESAAAGSGNESCVFPDTVPVGGGECPAACEGKTVAYEDCDGEGLVQAACGGDWFILQSACGDHQCQAGGLDQTCGIGSVCMELISGAHLLECRPHGCGTGPITCDCLQDACPGTCTQTGPLDFSCNTCPSNDCP